MRKLLFLAIIIASIKATAQPKFDSVTISRFLINDNLLGVNWKDTLKAGYYPNYLGPQTTIEVRAVKPTRGYTPLVSLIRSIESNGTGDVSKCFIPRHSMNFYLDGKINRYLLVCFECDGLRFSDDPAKPFIRHVKHRETQITELKKFFKELL
ncbi:MAG: hypothetical protein SGI83_07540 [Bacteroidota bacterium]|nr:hypothetical protein [Bacteroidota bacterium]